MWKFVLGVGGFVAGGGLAVAFVQFAPIWIPFLAGLLVGNLGVLVGIALDERAFTWRVILGLVGYFFGAALGGFLVWFIVSFRDAFAGGGLAGIFIGIPVGALVGSAVGRSLGSLLAKSPSREQFAAEPDPPADGGRDSGSS